VFGSQHVTTELYAQVWIYLKIHLYVYTRFILGNSLKVTKIDWNISELWQIVRKNIILTLVFLVLLLVVFFELTRVSCDLNENKKSTFFGGKVEFLNFSFMVPYIVLQCV
jgi:hypothetical protein